MALPATDNFNRADGALGANWTGSVGSDLAISSNTVIGSVGADSSMYWSADAPDAGQYAQCKLVATGAGVYRGPLVRVSGTDWVILDANQSTNYLIEWYNGGSWTQIGSTYATAPAANDVIKITADGTTFKGYINTTERISGSNGSAPATGRGGLYTYSNSGAGALDDFEVGNLAAAATGNPWYAYAQQ